MEESMRCYQVRIRGGERDGKTLWNVYTVGKKPYCESGISQIINDDVKEILVHHLQYTVAAGIYFLNGSYEYAEEVKRYILIPKDNGPQTR